MTTEIRNRATFVAIDLFMHHFIDIIVHTLTFVRPAVEHWLDEKLLNGFTKMDRSDHPPHFDRTFCH